MNISQLLRKTALSLMLVLAGLCAKAQMSEIFVENARYGAGEEVAVSVRGVNMEDAVGIQFSLTWDTLALDFLGVSDVLRDGSLEGNFNVKELNEGRIGFLVVDGNLVGLGITDSSLLFTLHFQPLKDGIETEISFVDSPIRGSINNRDNESIETVLTGGMVSIDMSTGLPGIAAEDIRFRAVPNPFVASTQLEIGLGYASKGRLDILDLNGRVLSSTTSQLNAGPNRIMLQSGDFPSAGPYILRLTTDREQLYRKVVAGRAGN